MPITTSRIVYSLLTLVVAEMRLLPMFVVVIVSLAAVPAAAADLTTVTSAEGRYIVNLGKNKGDTLDRTLDVGIYEIASDGGNSGAWWKINDGEVVDGTPLPNTFGGVAPDYLGYRFKQPADVTSVVFWNKVYFDGGTFETTPTLQVLDTGVWTPVTASCAPAYRRSPRVSTSTPLPPMLR